MDSTHIVATNTRLDIIADKLLTIGDYVLQNKSGTEIFVWLRDAAIADPADLDQIDAILLPQYNSVRPLELVKVEVLSGNAIYVSTRPDYTRSAIVGLHDG